MKYSIFAITLFLTYCSFAQNDMGLGYMDNASYNDPINTSYNEIRLNGLALLASPAIQLSYERIINASSGYGATVFVDFGDDVFDKDFSFTPFYRFYFLNQSDFGASGFFG